MRHHADSGPLSSSHGPNLKGVVNLQNLFLFFLVVYGLLLMFSPWGSPLELWDESRNANNSIEMALHGHWMVGYYDGAPDHWNTKPLFLIWQQAALIKLGISPLLAIRIPSALAAVGSVLLVYLFCRYHLRRPITGVFSALLLTSSVRYFGLHVAISADFDALLSFLVTAYCLSFWLYLEERMSARWLYVSGICVALAFLTKGIAGGLPLPGLLIYAGLRRRLLRCFSDWNFWLTLSATVSIVALFYLGRQALDPGYIHYVWQNEVGGRFSQVNEAHQASVAYYPIILLRGFEPGVLLLPFGAMLLISKREPIAKIRAFASFCAVVAVSLLVILSFSKTKIFYYCVPTFPFLALLAGLGLDRFLERLRPTFSLSLADVQKGRQYAIGSIVFCLILTSGFALYRIEGPSRFLREQPQAHYGKTLTDMKANGILGPIVILDDGVNNTANFVHYNALPLFFAEAASTMNMHVTVQTTDRPLPTGEWFLTCDPALVAAISSHRYPIADSPDMRMDGPCSYGILQNSGPH
jgi:4-amino-4-deoxy-L-arabinose transferase-like glycosyltransferase